MNTSRNLIVAIALSVSFLNVQANFQKNIHKSWPMQNVKALTVDSKFGNINFISNRDDSVTIDVLLQIENISASKAEAIAKQIEFYFTISDGTVSARTEFNDRFKTNSDFKIVYTINIPIDRHLVIENKFGDVTLGNLKAKGNFDIQYGNIYGQNLSAPNNEKIELNLKFGNATFNNINRLNAEVGYSKLNTGNIESAEFDTQYSTMKVGEVGTFRAESKYDTFTAKSVKDLTVESKFTGWKIDLLQSIFDITTQYGDITIYEVNKNFESIKIDNSFGNIKIGIPADASYQLESESSFCEVYFPNGEIIKKTEDNYNKYIKAMIGKTTGSAKVNINTRYGKVKLMN